MAELWRCEQLWNIDMKKSPTNNLVDSLFRKQRGKLIATMTNFMGMGRLESIEDIIQETFLAALKSWPTHPPDNAEAWLVRVAKNKAINYLKRQQRISTKAATVLEVGGMEERIGQFFLENEISNSQLRLLFTCCQLDISKKKKIILILRLVCGFDGAQIASALLLKRDAVFKILQRTLALLQGVPFSLETPTLEQSKKHLETVHTILYLLFNEGLRSIVDTKDLGMKFCEEALYLTHLLERHKIGDHHTLALKSLFYFHAARLESRLSQPGALILLKDQDRSQWNKQLIALGFEYLRLSNTVNVLGRFHLEAGIASMHCMAKSFEETDWEGILWYYDKLTKLINSPVIELNQTIAYYHCHGAAAAWKMLEHLVDQKAMENYYLFHAFSGELKFQLKQNAEALIHFENAMKLTKSKSEQQFLLEKIKIISSRPPFQQSSL